MVSEENDPLPAWMIYDKKSATLEGVPTMNDTGDTRINVKAYDNKKQSVSDVFVVEVYPLWEKNTNNKVIKYTINVSIDFGNRRSTITLYCFSITKFFSLIVLLLRIALSATKNKQNSIVTKLLAILFRNIFLLPTSQNVIS